MTAASWSFWDEAVERSFLRALHLLGVLEADELLPSAERAERLRAVFFGRVVTNISFHRAIARRMPPSLQTAFIVHLFASDELHDEAAIPRSRAHVWRMPWLTLRLPKFLRARHTEAKQWWRSVTDTERPAGDLESSVAALREAQACFEEAMTWNITASLLSAMPVQQIMAMSREAERPELAPAVIAGYGTEEALMAQRLSVIAAGGESVESFIRDFGFHGQAEGQLHRVSWREAPETVRARAASFENGVSARRSLETVRGAQGKAEQELLARVRSRFRLRFNLWLARRLAPQREITKAWYLMTIDAGRAALRQIGQRAVEAGHLELADDVFHLTVEEISSTDRTSWLAIAARRRAEFAYFQTVDVPQRFSGMPEPVLVTEAALEGRKSSSLRGIGASAGIAEGRARVIQEADSVDELCDGEVLVCRSTDPSWAPAFMITCAVVIDIGSLLSHGAIVARELGLPCVVNTGSATSMIKTGDLVRVNGSTGTVEITERCTA